MTPVFDKHILVCFNIPFEICLKQNKMRDPEKVVEDYAMKKLMDEYEAPDEKTIASYDEYIEVGPDFIANILKNK